MIDPDQQLIDERIDLARIKDRNVGTVVSRDTTGPGAMVTFDNSSVPIPVKVAGAVGATPGDKVLLTRHGSDWIVTESFSSSSFGEASRAVDGLPLATGALTSSAFVDLTEFGDCVFNKSYDLTFIRFQIQTSAFITGTSGQVARIGWAVRLVPIAGAIGFSATDFGMGAMLINPLSTHTAYTSMRRNTTVPAGTYTASLRWRRISGAASVFADTNDSFSLELDERVRALVPIL